MKVVQDFFNSAAKTIDSKYFPEVKYYRDDKDCEMVHNALELFNNGCLPYSILVSTLVKCCKDTKENIEGLLKPFIVEF